MNDIQLNFVPLVEQDKKIIVYRRLVEGDKGKYSSDDYRARLPLSEGSNSWLFYDVSMELKEGYEECQISFKTNLRYSEYYLLASLQKDLLDSFSCEYYLPKSKHKEISFITERYDRGVTEISIFPYFLKSRGLIGFIVQHNFRCLDKDNYSYDREIQQLSLSIDSMGRKNTFYFRDKEIKIRSFLLNHFSGFVKNKFYNVDLGFSSLKPRRLKNKSYIVKNNKVSNHQFMGVKNFGPFESIESNVKYLFVFSEKNRSLARDVYLGLIGKLFPAQFPGLEKMFNLKINAKEVNHLVVDGFDNNNLNKIEGVCNEIRKRNPLSKIMVFLITPKGIKDRDGDSMFYSKLKSLSLNMPFVCQVVTEDSFYRRESLKWSISNIALQVFCKLGGKPWHVKPEKNNCLIMGVGSAHKKKEGIIEKYTAYTVCLDSSGDFKYVHPLSVSNQEGSYLAGLEGSLRKLIDSELDNNYESIVLHLPFKIRRSEIASIRRVIDQFKGAKGCEFIVVKINTRHRFLGFGDHNTRVAYESTFVDLSVNEFLIWAEGLQEGKEVLNKRVSQPLLVEFLEPPNSWEGKVACLQDVLNLTGANWRGFNAKAQPISILYAKLIARFMKEISTINDNEDLAALRSESPWFL